MGRITETTSLIFIVIGLSVGNTPPPSGQIPSGATLEKIITGSFLNVDTDRDGFIQKPEFDSLVIIADKDNNGCLTLEEYKNFSASPPEIATRIYQHFHHAHDNCLTVNDLSSVFGQIDADANGKVTPAEFHAYYVKLLQILFNQPPQTVG